MGKGSYVSFWDFLGFRVLYRRSAGAGIGMPLFVAGAVFGEIWVDSRSAKCFNFQYKMRLHSAKSNLGE